MDRIVFYSSMTIKRPSLRHPGTLLATWFGAGYLPKAPGTWGSVAALPFAWIISSYFSWQGLALATLLIFVVGLWAAKVFEIKSGEHDPGAIVIDEVAGLWLTLIVVPPEPVLYLTGFLLFRLFDIRKPWPVSWADKSLPGAWGMMVDDIFAGIYAAMTLMAIRYF